MLALTQNNQITLYPLSLGQLRERFPNTSFNLPLVAADLADYGVVEVEIQPQPTYDTATQRLSQRAPALVNGHWVVGYDITDIPQAELDAIAEANTASAAASVRAQRDDLLRQSDWTQLADAPIDPAPWATYRQALRDVPQQAGFPADVSWPTQPFSN